MSFSPLRCWGGLYQFKMLSENINCFSPLRCWGGLYRNIVRSVKIVSFSPLRCWGGLYLIYSPYKLILLFQSPSILGWSISILVAFAYLYLVLVPFDIGVVYIRITSLLSFADSFSPLRYWGGLYQELVFLTTMLKFQSPSILGWSISNKEMIKMITISFSPLRYWGGLYQNILMIHPDDKVLVPFDIGVVYITWIEDGGVDDCFSPLRYWGGLYHNGSRVL